MDRMTNRMTSAFPWDNHYSLVCSQNTSGTLPISPHRTLKICVFKDCDLIRLVIFTTSLRTILSETGMFFQTVNAWWWRILLALQTVLHPHIQPTVDGVSCLWIVVFWIHRCRTCIFGGQLAFRTVKIPHMTPCLTHLWASSFAVNGVNSHGHFKLQGPSSIIHINIRGFSPLYLTALKSRGTRSSTCSQGGPLTVKLGHWKSLHSQGPRPTCFYHTGTGAGQKPDNWLCTWLLPPRDSLRSKPMELNT